jgi:hypothetical protein
MVAAELYFLAAMTASREMYGKSYFSLGVAEKSTLDNAVWQTVHSNFQNITPDLLKIQTDQKPVGFHPPKLEENPNPDKNEP